MNTPTEPLRIGSIIWIFNTNRRVYPKDSGPTSAPIYREHWEPCEIVGETSRSWIVKYGPKVPKNGPRMGVAFTAQEVDDDVWANDHRWKIERAVGQCRDLAKLRAIAEIIGYDSEKTAR